MAFSMLPTLRPGDWRAVICVRVCRKWAYRGGTDDGPIQHVDLVLVDQQGNSLYAEIPAPEVEAKSPLIDEGGVYVISRFRVSHAKSSYRAVDAPFMVEFTLHTIVAAPAAGIPDIPRYAYKITPIDALPAHAGSTKNFLDTIGTLVEMSDIQNVHMPNRAASTVSRHIILRDLSYSEMKITLWGERATAFTTEGVYDRNKANPIIVLFVGGLMKSYQDMWFPSSLKYMLLYLPSSTHYLSGNAACRWYFNPQVPEAREFYTSFHNQRLEIRSVAAPAQQQSQTRVLAQLEEKNLRDLNMIDPYDFSENGYRCTVTISRLLPNASWWFPSCTKCSKSCAPDGTGYRCVPCSNTSFKFKYKLCFLALDGTGDAEMVAFGDVARRMIGKPVQQLLRTASSANEYPAEITRLVSLRFTFAVTMSRQNFYRAQKTFNVLALVTSHGQPVPIHANPPHGDGGHESAAESGSSSGKSVDQDGLSLSATGTPDSTQASPAVLNTPPPTLETPVAKKRQRGESSKKIEHPSSRRRLLLDDDEADVDGANVSRTSSSAAKTINAQDDNTSHGHSSAQESG